MKNNWSLEDYQSISDDNKCPYLKVSILIFIIIGILFILYKIQFQVYEKQTLIKNDDEFLLIINSKKINEIESNNFIYINNKKYRYNIEKINQDYTTVDGVIYQTIYINPYNYKTDSVLTDCYFLKSEKSIFEMLSEFIKGGIG